MKNREFEKIIKQIPQQFLEEEQMPQEYSEEILKAALLEKINVQQYQEIIENVIKNRISAKKILKVCS